MFYNLMITRQNGQRKKRYGPGESFLSYKKSFVSFYFITCFLELLSEKAEILSQILLLKHPLEVLGKYISQYNLLEKNSVLIILFHLN